MTSRTELETRVVTVVAAALDHSRDAVTLHSSLIDDLGAESIDFLDIVFRLETEFAIKIPNEEVWAGAFQRTRSDPAAIAEGVQRLRERMPQFDWTRLPQKIEAKDLPRLITPSTIVDYLARRFEDEGAP